MRRRATLTVARRLFLGLLPALLAVLVTVGLAYYGEFGRAAPNAVVGGAALLSLVSLGVTWANTRYLATRVARLSGTVNSSPGEVLATPADDEFDRIERAADHLGSALAESKADRERADAAAATRLHDEATMLAGVVRDSTTQLDELRLPLHILLETRFGDLNENQEELIRDARVAADAMAAALHRLGQLADADRGALVVRRELVQVTDVVRAILPLARAVAAKRGARVDVSFEPGLPRIMADRARLAEALALLADRAARSVEPDRPMVLSTASERDGVVITIGPSADDDLLAGRLVTLQGGTMRRTDGSVVVRLPSQATSSLVD
jgi:signal transduction histidine kinase